MGWYVSQQVRANIVKDKLNDPTLTTRELQAKYEKDGIKSNSTVGTIIKNEITRNAQSYDEMIKANNEIIKQANKLILEKFRDQKESLRVSEISAVKDVSFKQNQLLTGWATDNINLKVSTLSEKTVEELQEMLEDLN